MSRVDDGGMVGIRWRRVKRQLEGFVEFVKADRMQVGAGSEVCLHVLVMAKKVPYA